MREHGQGKEVEVTQRDGGQGLGGDMADHDGVDHAHGHHPDLDDDHRYGEPQHGPKLGPPGEDPTH